MKSRRRWATRNPVADIELPAKSQRADLRYLTPDEVSLLINAVPDSPYRLCDRALYRTAAMTGLRIGELTALRWMDVDWQNGLIRVRRTYGRIGGEFTDPKSERSVRAVPLPPTVGGELKRMLRERLGDVEPRPAALVFADPERDSGPLLYQAALDRVRSTLEAAGLDKKHGFHSLRHTFGTAMAAAGKPIRSIQAWMGHRDITTT